MRHKKSLTQTQVRASLALNSMFKKKNYPKHELKIILRPKLMVELVISWHQTTFGTKSTLAIYMKMKPSLSSTSCLE